MKSLVVRALAGLAALSVASCAYGGTASVVVIADEPAGANCEYGGIRVDVGPDGNEDGAPDSVVSSSYVCNGAGSEAPPSSLTNVVSEAPGENCASGGVRIEAGLDTDRSGTLEATEVISSEYVCNGGGGSGGPSSLTGVTPEPAGANCAEGGVRIDNGVDGNGNGTLDSAEIATTDYICDGSDGAAGLGTLSDVSVEPAGSACSEGGVKIDTGVDANANGMLESGEITDTTYVCNGDPTAAFGTTPIVSAYDENEVRSSGTTAVTTISASITVPRPGTVLAIAGVEAYCSPSAAPRCASSGNLDGYFTVSQSASGAPDSGDYSYFFLTANTSENITRNAVFNVGAGAHSFYGRARNDNSTGGGEMGFWRRQLTLIFVPND